MPSKMRTVQYITVLINCDGVKYLLDLLNIDQVQAVRDKFDKKIYTVATSKGNINITDRVRRWEVRWEVLIFKEALHISEKYNT